MRFRDGGELAVYRALKRPQASAPKQDSLTPAQPGGAHACRLDVGTGLPRRLSRQGRHHRGRRRHASRPCCRPQDRDRFFEDSGIASIDRWVVEDTTDDAELDALVERFLRKLAG
jgi:hypothetical protein